MAFALLTHTAKGATASNTVTTTAIDTTGATVIAIVLAGSLGAFTPSDLSDSASNQAAYLFCPVQNAGLILVFIINPATSASHTFTYTQTFSYPSLAVASFSGAAGGLQTSDGANNVASTTVQPGSLTPSGANGLLVTGYTNNLSTGTPTFTIDSSFIKTDQIDGGATPSTVALAYLIQTSAVSVNPTWTTSTSAANTTMMAVVNLLGGAGGGGTTGFASA